MSPPEAPQCDGASGGSPEVVLASRLIRGIRSGLEAFILDKREDSYDALTRVLNASGVRGLLLVKDLGPYVVVYLDRGALERRCMYERCSTAQNSYERKLCARKCVTELLPDVINEVSKSLCEAARSIGSSVGGAS
ncbi:MAG: hypothetical protein OSP8Acid_06220 [uncultured Acidilobus sp. OSP8]|nr:MAG: hypothetical protein OSP8Acid_06220 [uncultured Acidilobus sp. OSP8]